MVKISVLLEEGKLSKINELELNRYIEFFTQSYKNNLEHSKFTKDEFPRWSIISSYYAMHDISKLFFAKHFSLKVEYEVHATTIKALRELIKNKDIIKLMDNGYNEFKTIANDLAIGKKERVQTQYYTGTQYMKEQYEVKCKDFLENTAIPFIDKINKLLEA